MIKRAIVLYPIVGLFVFVLCDRITAKPAHRPNIILITLDTTRADRLGCYGSKTKTEFLDRLAASGARFESAYTSVPNTLPSHASILTGQYPFRTGVRDNLLHRLSDSAVTLAEILKMEGYQTLAFISAAVLDRTFGLQQGFDHYDDQMPDRMLYGERTAEQLNSSVYSHLNYLKSPYFLWLHYYDPHIPYNAPPQFRKDSEPYDAEIAYMDHSIGEMFGRLPHSQNTIVAIVGDHGESLGEHGEKTHGLFLYSSAMRVPLLISYPGLIRQKTVVRGLTRTVDLMPTILDYAGVQFTSNIDGQTLRKAIDTGTSNISSSYEETLLPQNHYGWSGLYGLRTLAWHFILAPSKELYNLTADPFESTNLAQKFADKARNLETELKRFPLQQTKNDPPEVSEELREKISSLGYISSSGMEKSAGKIDPKDGISILTKIDQATELITINKIAEAKKLLHDVLQNNPQNIPARMMLGRLHHNTKSYLEAQHEYEKALEFSNVDTIHMELALTLVNQRKFEEAAAHYKDAVAMNPRQLKAYLNWAELELQQKKGESVEKILQQAASQNLVSAELSLLRGRLAGFRKQYADAISFFKKAVQEDSANAATAYYHLGNTYLQIGNRQEAIVCFQEVLKRDPNNASVQEILRRLSTSTYP